MATCFRSLGEQVLFQVRGGDPSAGASIEYPEIKQYLSQLINQRIKTAYFSETMAAGERVPDGLVIGTYSDVAVESYKTDYSRVALPVTPISLPNGLGVFSVRGSDDVFGLSQFIPIPPGQFAMYTQESLISDILGQVGYELKNGYIVFTKDITAMSPSVTTVDLDLVVSDPDKAGDYDILQIPADMQASIVQDAVKFFLSQVSSNKIVDSSSDNPAK